VQSVMCAYNSIDEFAACTNKMLLKDHLRDAWGFKGFVVSDCGAIVDVNQRPQEDAGHHALRRHLLQAGTDLSCSIWTPGFNTLADAVKQGLVLKTWSPKPPSASTPPASSSASSILKAQTRSTLFPSAPTTGSLPNRAVAEKAAEEASSCSKTTARCP
jgi:beta-glucosidase